MNENIVNNRKPDDEVLYHIALCHNDLEGAEIAVLPGDPGRVLYLAEMLDSSPKKLAVNREYTSYLANVGNKKVLIISTGMGSPSVGIGLEELAMIGIKKFIRVGTTGAIQQKIDIGDLILSTGAVRLDGTSKHYAPLEYPAVSDFELNMSLSKSASDLSISMHCGITASSDTFYPGQERYDNYSGFVRKHFKDSLDEWRSLNVMNFEMEASAMFTICSVFGLKAACICAVIAKRTQSESVDKSKYDQSMRNIMSIIKHTVG
ncbi:MAG: uridine phosphorylase [Proteobacteria bacterium]|nr:uridine phosphorylase [Pseudomonadota bacterium]